VLHDLPATPTTVRWGHFDNTVAPVLTVASGDLVRIRTSPITPVMPPTC